MGAADPQKVMKDLYEALMDGNRSKVIELYQKDVLLKENNVIKVIKPYSLEVQFPNEYPLTTFHDTVLHIATYSGQNELVQDLLNKIIPSNESDVLKKVNDLGDTILHESTTNTRIDLETIGLILNKQKDLLTMRNNNGESPLFRAVHFGNEKMFEDLDKRISELEHPEPEVHWRRKDGVNILHIAVLREHFKLALVIAQRYNDLLIQRDQDGMTALHLLSSMPSAFKSGCNHGWLRSIIYFAVPNGDLGLKSKWRKCKAPTHYDVCIRLLQIIALGLRMVNQQFWKRIFRGWPVMREILQEKRRHESAFQLAKYLIEQYHSWQESDPGGDPEKIVVAHKSRRHWKKLALAKFACAHSADQNFADTNIHEKGVTSILDSPSLNDNSELVAHSDLMDASAFENSFNEPKIEDPNRHKPETPLLIATSNGIIEIVKEILEVHPQAIEHVSYTGQNILHVSIKNRRKDIFDVVKSKKIPMTRLARRIDKKGNTALHQVGNMGTYRGIMPGPALQLQEELLWYKLVKDVLPSHFQMHLNEDGLNAHEFFQENHKDLLIQAQDWLKRTSQSCSVVAVLIATVAFAAAYTVPGGNEDSGLPILIGEPFFLVFTVMDVVSLASSLTSVVMFLSILTSPFQYHDFKRSLPRKLTFGFTFLFLSVATMMLAFAATVILTIRTNKNTSKILIYTVAFLPVSIFALLQLPLYLALTNTAQYSIHIIKKALPSSNCSVRKCLTKISSKTK